jgi:hypothetical protein
MLQTRRHVPPALMESVRMTICVTTATTLVCGARRPTSTQTLRVGRKMRRKIEATDARPIRPFSTCNPVKINVFARWAHGTTESFHQKRAWCLLFGVRAYTNRRVLTGYAPQTRRACVLFWIPSIPVEASYKPRWDSALSQTIQTRTAYRVKLRTPLQTARSTQSKAAAVEARAAPMATSVPRQTSNVVQSQACSRQIPRCVAIRGIRKRTVSVRKVVARETVTAMTPVSPLKLLVFSSIALQERQGPPPADARTSEDTPRMNAKTQPIRATNAVRASRFVGQTIKETVGEKAVKITTSANRN